MNSNNLSLRYNIIPLSEALFSSKLIAEFQHKIPMKQALIFLSYVALGWASLGVNEGSKVSKAQFDCLRETQNVTFAVVHAYG